MDEKKVEEPKDPVILRHMDCSQIAMIETESKEVMYHCLLKPPFDMEIKDDTKLIQNKTLNVEGWETATFPLSYLLKMLEFADKRVSHVTLSVKHNKPIRITFEAPDQFSKDGEQILNKRTSFFLAPRIDID